MLLEIAGSILESKNTESEQRPEQEEKNRYLEAFRWMILARIMEEKIGSLYKAGRIVGGVYTGKGQEAFSSAMAVCLKKGDIFGPLIRDMAGRLAFGEPLIDVPRTYFGSVKGPMRGRDGNIHRGRPLEGMPAMISHLGSLVSVVCGMLVGKRFNGETKIVGATSIGDGGTSTGSFHEAMNMAAVEKLPLVVAVANNQYAYSTPIERQYACDNLVDRARGYGVQGHSVDGTDLGKCLAVFREAVDRARRGEGPQMVVGSLLRLSGHGEHDDANYVPDSMREDSRDCIEVAREEILKRTWATREQIEKWWKTAQKEVVDAVGSAQADPTPDPYSEPWFALATRHLIEGNSTA